MRDRWHDIARHDTAQTMRHLAVLTDFLPQKNGTIWHAILRGIVGTKFVPLRGLLNTEVTVMKLQPILPVNKLITVGQDENSVYCCKSIVMPPYDTPLSEACGVNTVTDTYQKSAITVPAVLPRSPLPCHSLLAIFDYHATSRFT